MYDFFRLIILLCLQDADPNFSATPSSVILMSNELGATKNPLVK